MTHFKHILLAILLLIVSTGAFSSEDNDPGSSSAKKVYVQGGGYTHFSSSEDYKGTPWFTSAEVRYPNNWLAGLGLFNNSFDQFSQYAYGGYIFNLDGALENIHVKITAGIVHGYKDEFQDKIPMNNSGYAPAIIPGIGWKKDKLGVDMILLGDAGLLFTVGYDIFEF